MKLNSLNPVKILNRYNRFYSAQDTIENKIFWRVVPLTTLVGVGSVIGTISEGLGVWAVLTGVMCLIVPAIIMILCYKTGNDCGKYYSIFCIALNCLLGPAIFLTNGGLNSGMPMYCFVLLLLCPFCTTKRRRHITTSLAFYTYVTLFIVSTLNKQIVIPIDEDFIQPDIILSFGVATTSFTIILSAAVEQFSHQKQDKLNSALIASFGTFLERRSFDNGVQTNVFKKLMTAMLQAANDVIPDCDYSSEEIEMISSAALMHDIGTVTIPDSILSKPGKLTPEEFDIVKKHPIEGCRMLESMKSYQDHEYYEYLYQICRYHHERYDGSGYPDGLKGEEIPLVAQLASVADTYEALTSRRVYKKSLSCEDAADVILNRSTGYYSERVLDCFRLAEKQFKEIVNANKVEK